MHHLRPIALCNVLYKIVSKMLALRMKNVLAQIVNPIQSAFLPNCFILDNVIIAYEVLHHMKRYHHGEHGMAALKLDMSKAYDRVEWVFLHQLMMKMGFDWRWISLLMLCVETVRYSVIQGVRSLAQLIQNVDYAKVILYHLSSSFCVPKAYQRHYNSEKIKGLFMAVG